MDSIPTDNQNESQTGRNFENSNPETGIPKTEAEEPDFVNQIPFHLRWSFGKNPTTPMCNLTNNERNQFFITASQAGIIQDYGKNTMLILQGHKNIILDISCDDTGDWLVSIDKGSDGTIIVWDSRSLLPVHTIFNAYPNGGASVIAMSGNAKYLIAIGRNFEIFFWLWTYGNQSPDDRYQANQSYGKPKKVTFNPNVQEHIMVIFERQVLFLLWNRENKKLIELTSPIVKNQKSIGINNNGTYIGDSHESLSCTAKGYVVIFGNTLYHMDYNAIELDNAKIFVKSIKISNESITDIKYVDNLITIVDAAGQIKFYDKRLRLLYWLKDYNLPPIICISFNLVPREYKLIDLNEIAKIDKMEDLFKNFEETEMLYYQTVPTDASLEKNPFVIRNFLISCTDGKVYFIDVVNSKIDYFGTKVTQNAIAIDAHDEFPHIIIAYKNGRVCLFNYETHELLAETVLIEENSCLITTTVKFSNQGLHLAVGQSNGEIFMLDAIILDRKAQLNPTNRSVKKISFSNDLQYFASLDISSTVSVFYYEKTEHFWKFLGKIKAHYKTVTDMIFSPYFPSRLFTIGEDKCLVEYDLNPLNDELLLIQREQIDQSSIPNCCIFYPAVPAVEHRYFLIADNKFKFKWISDENLMCRRVVLAPSHGCYSLSSIKKIQLLPNCNNKYLIFSNDNFIGIQKLPIDGSPYRYVGTVGHPNQLIDFAISYDGKYVFTNGSNDTSVLMWEINLRSSEQLELLAGKGIEPFYPLIEGGIDGWLLKEMKDLFYYIQILDQGENTVLPRIVNEQIPINLLPELIRACGFYPTEYELENLMVDIRYRDYDVTENIRNSITFFDFVILFLNHRPAHGISVEELKNNFNTVCKLHKNSTDNSTISRNQLIDVITKNGEQLTQQQVIKCFFSLCNQDENVVIKETKNFDFLPETFNFDNLFKEILGFELATEENPENLKPAE